MTKSTLNLRNVITARSHASATQTADEETTETSVIKNTTTATTAAVMIKTNTASNTRRAMAVDIIINHESKRRSSPHPRIRRLFSKPLLKAKK